MAGLYFVPGTKAQNEMGCEPSLAGSFACFLYELTIVSQNGANHRMTWIFRCNSDIFFLASVMNKAWFHRCLAQHWRYGTSVKSLQRDRWVCRAIA